MIYFIQEFGLGAIKIGYSEDATLAFQRVALLQVGNPHKLSLLGVMSGELEDEQALHERFAKDSIRGEWFKASDNLLSFIKDKAAQDINTPLLNKSIIKSEWKINNKRQPKEKLIIYTDARYHSIKEVLRSLPFDSADNISIEGRNLV